MGMDHWWNDTECGKTEVLREIPVPKQAFQPQIPPGTEYRPPP
jgi:hypothetical protein